MGTRNLTMVIKQEKPVIAQYGQWDGYPSGQGVKILNFLTTKSIKKFKKKLELVRFATDEDKAEVESFMNSIGSSDGWMTMDQSDKYNRKYPLLGRDNGADVLYMIQDNNNPVFLMDSSNFANNSLFCEWAYVVDLDKETFEVYEGFNQTPLDKSERFYSPEKTDTDSKYHPVRLLKSYSLNDLPSKSTFLKECEIQEEE